MTESPNSAAPGDPAGARAVAERDMLLELIAVFTHDLSNPLQSITVLCELGLEGASGDDGPSQCLQAAERMRRLIHGLSGFTRGLRQPTNVGGVVERIKALLARRFDRHQLVDSYGAETIASIPAPGPLEFCLLAVCMGVLATASGDRRRGRVAVEGRPEGAHALLIVRATTDDGGFLPPDDKHTERARAIGGSEIGVTRDEAATILRFGIPQ